MKRAEPTFKRRIRKAAPFIISGILVIVLATYAPWGEVWEAAKKLSILSILLLVGLSLLFYLSKIIRFWYLLVAMGIRKPFWIVAMSYISAQPASILPGGEIFRSTALERQAGVPFKKSIAQFTTQGILEGAGLATVMLTSAIALHAVRIPAIILSVLIVAALILLSRGYMAGFLRLLNRIPIINIADDTIHHFNERHKVIFSKRWLPQMYIMSVGTELIGTAIAYVSLTALGGELNVWQAGLMYSIPVVVGFISLLPSGFGLSEQSAIGVLLLSKVSIGQAVAATLIMRITLVGLGIVYGAIALFLSKTRLKRMAANSELGSKPTAA